MRKRKVEQPRRTLYRMARSEADGLKQVLRIVNGDVANPDRFGQARSRVRDAFDRIIDYCDQVEEAVNAEGRTRYDRIDDVERIGDTLLSTLRSVPRQFTVSVLPNHYRQLLRVAPDDPELLEDFIESLPPQSMPSAEQLFRLKHSFSFVTRDAGAQLFWDFFHGVTRLDDLRRLRRCSAYPGYLHEKPYYFIRTKIQRQENSFCSDQGRSQFNYKKLIEAKSNGSQRKTTKARR